MTQTITYTDDLTNDTATSDVGLPEGWCEVEVSIKVSRNHQSAIQSISDVRLTLHASTLDNVHDVIIEKGSAYLADLDATIIAAGGSVPS